MGKVAVHAQFPEKLQFLFEPHRYKVAFGGRGSGKSWSFARALLLQAAMRPLRVLCAREVQLSIADSVHRLLSDQIAALGLSHLFEILQTEIRGPNGSLFAFRGLSTQTADSLKSFEGVDIVWVEEAHKVTRRSWDILQPTIRKDGSEIWISYNPELDTDETHVRFAVNPQPNSFVQKVNYTDNPWFPAVLEAERLEFQRRDPEAYKNVWDGMCKPAVEGAVYYNEMQKVEESGRICHAPMDRLLRTHTIWDFGFNDSMVVILAQRLASEIRIVGYIEDSHRKVSDYVADLQAMPNVNWGTDFVPHDGYHHSHQTGTTTAEIMKRLGRTVAPVPDVDVEEGIKQAREKFDRVYFNRAATPRLVECLKRYRRAVSKVTGEAGRPLHDEFSHGADAFRYLMLVADDLTNDEQSRPVREIESMYGEHGWMAN